MPQNQLAIVVKEADGLDPDLCPSFDDAAVEILTGQPGSRLPRLLAAARETIQARTADERHEKARVHRSVRFEPGRDGMGVLRLEGPLDRLAALDQAVHSAAVAAHGHAGETRTIGQLRYDIVEDVLFDGIRISAAWARDALLGANPDGPQWRQNVPARKQVVPTVVLHVPALTLLGQSDELPTIDGIGPVPPAVARRLCADAPSFYRVLTHPVTGTRITLDRTTYSPPADLRRWVQIRDEYCRFPGCTRPAHQCDIDHIREWRHTGVTNQDNLIALSRDKHVLKTMGLYRVDGDPNGTITFTSPIGIRHASSPRKPAQPAPPAIRDWATHALDGNDCPF